MLNGRGVTPNWPMLMPTLDHWLKMSGFTSASCNDWQREPVARTVANTLTIDLGGRLKSDFRMLRKTEVRQYYRDSFE